MTVVTKMVCRPLHVNSALPVSFNPIIAICPHATCNAVATINFSDAIEAIEVGGATSVMTQVLAGFENGAHLVCRRGPH